MDSIFRPVTDSEKSDFVELSQPNILDLFLGRLAEKRVLYAQRYRPFDSYCARIDFEELLRKSVGDLATSIDRKRANTNVEFPDLEKYGDPDRFELLSTKDVFEDKLLDGIRNTVKTGKEFNYKSKIKGNRITVFVPLIDLPQVEEQLKKDTVKAVPVAEKQKI